MLRSEVETAGTTLKYTEGQKMSNGSAQFSEVETVRDPDGVIAVVTQSLKDGRVSFCLAREFELNGETKRSSYMARRHVAAARRLLDAIEQKMELAEDRARANRRK